MLYLFSVDRRGSSSRYGTLPPHARYMKAQTLVGLVPCVIDLTAGP